MSVEIKISEKRGGGNEGLKIVVVIGFLFHDSPSFYWFSSAASWGQENTGPSFFIAKGEQYEAERAL